MKILHVLDHSIPLHSGYTFRTAAILREQRALGWETFQLTSPRQKNSDQMEEMVDGLHFYRSSAFWDTRIPGVDPPIVIASIYKRLSDVVESVRPDLIHAHSPALNAVAALWVGRKFRIPVAYEIRAFWEDAAVDHGTTTEGSMRYRLSRLLETYAVKRANHVFTICRGLKDELESRGIPDSKITVIPNAVDIEKFFSHSAPDLELKHELGLDDATVIGFIGSFYAYEGLDLLLDAVPAILAQMPEVKVLLTGGGPQEAALKDQAKRMGIEDSVVFTGRVAHADVGRYYDLIDVLVYPRHSMRLTELVTPLKPLEAMAQGRLFVASDVGGHRELIRDGETGVLFRAGNASDLADKVIGLLRNPQRWPGLKRQARHFVEAERTWKSSVSRYAEPYHEMLS